MINKNYSVVSDLTKLELLGCDPIIDTPGNFEVVRDRLELTTALFRTRAIAAHILEQIDEEAEDLPLKYHEYVINELQYEYRVASYFEKTNPGYEDRLLEIYGRWLEKRFPAAMIAQILETTRSNREKRIRS